MFDFFVKFRHLLDVDINRQFEYYIKMHLYWFLAFYHPDTLLSSYYNGIYTLSIYLILEYNSLHRSVCLIE